MRRHRPVLLLACFASITAAPVAAAEPERSPAPPPGNRVEVIAEERVRSENWDNLFDFSDATDDTTEQWRFRTRFGAKFDLASRLELMVLFNNESRKITEPDTPSKWDEVIFETLYADYRFGDRWSARLGRQNVMRGEGFVIFDGNALDGSRTAYFNALDVAYAPEWGKLEFLAISDPSQDQYLPQFNDRDRPLTEWDESALGLYFTRRAHPETSIDAYYFFKTETDDVRGPGGTGYQPDRSLHTLGARVARQIGKGWSVTAEAAAQRGSQDPDTDIRAWGGYAYVKKDFEAAGKPSVSLGWIGMSGDDAATKAIEGWDPLFSRWPKWSELYIYSLVKEKGVAYWSNLAMWQAEFLIAPVKPLTLRATYYWMSAFHPYPGSSATFGTGKDRGDMLQIRADLAFAPHWSGHLLYEGLQPGDFYAGRDGAYFWRAEVIYSFKKTVPLSGPAS